MICYYVILPFLSLTLQSFFGLTREFFGNTARQKKILSQHTDHLDHKESDLGLLDEELRLLNKLKEEIQDTAYKEESIGNKNPKSIGLNTGTTNTSFFHKFAYGRKARTFISSLNIKGSLVEDEDQIKKELNSTFNALYSKKPLHQAWFEISEG